MKVLNAVFCYNRYHLLRNTVESLYEFGPAGDVLIVDDGSDDPRVTEYLESLKGRSATVVRRKHEVGSHGSLYANMNLAVAHAIERGYSHIFFIQDDVQFMWRDDEYLQRVERVFRVCPDAAMVFPMFLKGIQASTLPARLEPDDAGQCWHLTPYGMCDMGIMPVSLLREKNWSFGNSEGENGRIWREWGYKLYAISAPTLAWVPWPEVRTMNSKKGIARAPVEKYLLKPLSQSQIRHLRESGISRIPIHEDYCLPWKWRCLSPYWFTKGRLPYFKILWATRRWPRIVTAP